MKVTMDTNKPGLDIEGLKAIVKLCVKNNVKSLKWQGIELGFGEQAELSSGDTSALPRDSVAKKTPVKEITDEQHSENSKRDLERDVLNLRADQIAELQITDPSAAESMILNGELDDDGGDTDRPGEE